MHNLLFLCVLVLLNVEYIYLETESKQSTLRDSQDKVLQLSTILLAMTNLYIDDISVLESKPSRHGLGGGTHDTCISKVEKPKQRMITIGH